MYIKLKQGEYDGVSRRFSKLMSGMFPSVKSEIIEGVFTKGVPGFCKMRSHKSNQNGTNVIHNEDNGI